MRVRANINVHIQNMNEIRTNSIINYHQFYKEIIKKKKLDYSRGTIPLKWLLRIDMPLVREFNITLVWLCSIICKAEHSLQV